MRKHLSKFIILAAAAVCFIFMVTGCSKEVTVTVKDQNISTEIIAKTGASVSDVLAAAGLNLGEKDEVVPSAETLITEDTGIITVNRFAQVTVKDGDDAKEVSVTGGIVADALKEAGVQVTDNDHVSAGLSDFLSDGMVIEITHKKVVLVKADGGEFEAATDAAKVADLISELNLELGEDDEISMELSADISDGDVIVIKRVVYEEISETEDIPFDSQQAWSDSLSQGTSEVTRQGENGEKTSVYKVRFVDGTEESRELISEEITKEPVDEIITYGTYVYSAPEPEPEHQGVYEVSRTAFPNCADGSHGYYEIHWSDGSTTYEEY